MTTTTGVNSALSAGDIAYFRGRQKNRIYESVFKKFIESSQDGELTRAKIARRLRKDPAQITRWLSGPGNWTLETVSDLLLAMGAELEPKIVPLDGRPMPNYANQHNILNSEQTIGGATGSGQTAITAP